MGKISFEPLRIRRLSEIIEDSIKDLILTGELKVGSKLPTEKEISKQFGVSIVTVREALRGLEAFGIIQKKRGKNGGIFVTQTERHIVKSAVQSFLSSEKFTARDLNEVRSVVEPPCVRIAASRLTPDELKDTVDYLEDFLLSFKKLHLVPDIRFSTETIRGHRRNYTALKKGDAKVAEEELLQHIAKVGEYLEATEH